MDNNKYIDMMRDPKTTRIPDNEFLLFIPMKETLMAMEVGSIIIWPAKKYNALKSAVSSLNKAQGTDFRIRSAGPKDIYVCRFKDRKI